MFKVLNTPRKIVTLARAYFLHRFSQVSMVRTHQTARKRVGNAQLFRRLFGPRQPLPQILEEPAMDPVVDPAEADLVDPMPMDEQESDHDEDPEEDPEEDPRDDAPADPTAGEDPEDDSVAWTDIPMYSPRPPRREPSP